MSPIAAGSPVAEVYRRGRFSFRFLDPLPDGSAAPRPSDPIGLALPAALFGDALVFRQVVDFWAARRWLRGDVSLMQERSGCASALLGAPPAPFIIVRLYRLRFLLISASCGNMGTSRAPSAEAAASAAGKLGGGGRSRGRQRPAGSGGLFLYPGEEGSTRYKRRWNAATCCDASLNEMVVRLWTYTQEENGAARYAGSTAALGGAERAAENRPRRTRRKNLPIDGGVHVGVGFSTLSGFPLRI